jgi:predicted AAA+ superfamily ATPase
VVLGLRADVSGARPAPIERRIQPPGLPARNGVGRPSHGPAAESGDIARDAALPHPTTHRYLNLLETGCLVTRLRPFATNPNVALVKTPKLHWTDCGLAASLAGIKTPAEATARPDADFWLEQTLFQTLQSWRALDPLQRKLHFWRDRPGHEVDFILEQDGKLVALEIKAGSTVTSSDAAGIRAFRDSLKKKQVLVRSVVLHAGHPRSGHRVCAFRLILLAMRLFCWGGIAPAV